MKLNDNLIWALEEEDLSFVEVYCEDDIETEVANFIKRKFTVTWNTALADVNKEYSGCDLSQKSPLRVEITDDCILLHIKPLVIMYAGGDCCALDYGIKVLDDTLDSLKAEYPVSFKGYIAFPWYDVNGGEICQYNISSSDKVDEDETYDYIGKIIGRVLSNNQNIWIRQNNRNNENLVFALSDNFGMFSKEEIVNLLDEIEAESYCRVSNKTDYLINTNYKELSFINSKAAELGIPVITAEEFMARFSDSDECGVDEALSSHFWNELADNLYEIEDYKDIITQLCAYSQWINKSELDRTIQSLIDLSIETNEKITDELRLFVKNFR